MSTILITGAAGFIGTHLTSRLAREGHRVVALDKQDKRDLFSGQIVCDITDEAAVLGLVDQLRGESIDACVHLAAIAAPRIAQAQPSLAWSTNVHGTYNVLQLLHRLSVRRMIFFSSAHVYGISPRYMPTDENHPLALHDTYTSTKIAGEKLCELFYTHHRISYTTLRLFNGYGPGQSEDYFLGVKLKEARLGGPVVIRDAGVTKDWIHVSDVVAAACLALKTEYVGPLNIGTGVETSLGEICHEIATTCGIDILHNSEHDAGPTRMCADNRRARATLGWEPHVPFGEGLQALIVKEIKR